MPENPINRIQQQIFGKYKEADEEDIDFIHHVLMKEYGWIPLDEFRDLPLPTLWNLLKCIKKEKEAEEKELQKIKHIRK